MIFSIYILKIAKLLLISKSKFTKVMELACTYHVTAVSESDS